METSHNDGWRSIRGERDVEISSLSPAHFVSVTLLTVFSPFLTLQNRLKLSVTS